MSETSDSTDQMSITESLGVYGWQHLDPIILASLATEAPLLLIGPHGTAKTLLVEQIAVALGLEFRHYNASLINYDDLVGIPLPDETHKKLEFITTPGAIWDAGFVFFDEISRCRGDLQNKLFPIIHEKRVIGLPLEHLQFRWAAMNPPSPDEPDFNNSATDIYLGSEPLDPALIDRFPFVIPVPNWRDLENRDRRRMLNFDLDKVDDVPALALLSLIQQCRDGMVAVEHEYGEWLGDYMIYVMDLLYRAKLSQSPRRARMLLRSIVAVHSARRLLSNEVVDMDVSAEIALLYGLPQTATEVPPTPSSVVAIHRQAWEISTKLDNDSWRQVLEEDDAVKRILIAEEVGFSDEELGSLVTQALAAYDSDSRKVGLAVAMYLAFSTSHKLTPAAWEPISNLATRVLQPRQMTLLTRNNQTDLNNWNNIQQWVIQQREDKTMTTSLEVNFVLGGFPELWRTADWNEALRQFRDDLISFGITEV
jgi:MoxR-like ATPase